MRTLLAAALAVTLSLTFNSSGAKAEDGEDGGLFDDLSIDYYRDVGRRFPERIGFGCWAAYETYKRGDFQNALPWFEACAQRNHPQSMIFLSQIYMDGFGVAKDPAASTQWLRRAAETGYSVGQYNYGLALLRGEGTPSDSESGKAWVRKAAAQGDSDARALAAADFDLTIVATGGQRMDGRQSRPGENEHRASR